MVLKVTVTPLYGSHTDGHALATLLTLDGLNILLDCGWNSNFDPTLLENLTSIAPTVHAVLLSHPDVPHLGALPYAFAHLGLSASVFSTLPVWRMGQMSMYDAYLSHDATGPFSLFNLDDVDAAFDYSPESENKRSRFTLLKYQQHFPLDALPHGAGVIITPHRAGHIVGGTVWHLAKGTETIVYAAHINHRKERHLNPTTLSNFSRPAHLIVSATNATTRAEGKSGPDALIEAVRRTVSRGGNVLVPVDTSGRVVELAVQLETACEQDEGLRRATVAVVHPLSTRTFDFARSMIEWMSDEVVRRFDVSRDNLFVFSHVKLLRSVEELSALSGPHVVLASGTSMEMGTSRELFTMWAASSRNAVVLTDRAEPGTLYEQLYRHAGVEGGKGELSVDLKIGKKVALQGEELEKWRESERNRKRAEAEAAAEEERKELEKEEAAAASAAAAAKAAAGEAGSEAGENGGTQENGTVKIRDQDADGDVEMGDSEKGRKESEEEMGQRVFDTDLMKRLVSMGVLETEGGKRFGFKGRKEMEWDHYGQKVETVRFIIGEDPGEGGLMEEKEKITEVEEVEEMEEEKIPTKHVWEEMKVDVGCELVLADCAGLCDGESLKRVLKEVEARHVTVIGGSVDESSYLGGYLRKTMGEEGVKVPKVMERVEVVSELSVVQVSLDDRLVEEVEWKGVGLSRIGFVDGVMSEEVDEQGLGVAGRKGRGDGQAGGVDEIGEGHGTVLVGTVMLNRLKEGLERVGVKSEFAGGMLCVETGTGGTVVVKKVGGQHLSVEGNVCEEYWTVRDVVHSQVVIPT